MSAREDDTTQHSTSDIAPFGAPMNSNLTVEAVNARRRTAASEGLQLDRVMFRVAALYGLSPEEGIRLPLNRTESINSGQVTVSLDPEAGQERNVGVIDYKSHQLKVRYGGQFIFPGLYELVTTKSYDPGLLTPVRAEATDECTVKEDYSGWHALGCLDFLPGSLWSGASGG